LTILWLGEQIDDIMVALDKMKRIDIKKPFNIETIDHFDSIQKLGKKGLRQMNRSAVFSTYAALKCLSDSRLIVSDASNELGVVLGTQFGHLDRQEQMMKVIIDEGSRNLNPTDAGYGGLNVLASMISIRVNAKSVNATINNGCTSGLDAIQYACWMINRDHAKYILVGGVETTSTYYLEWLQANNFNLAYEGAGFIHLEKPETATKRGAKIYAFIRDYSTFPYVEANGIAKSIDHALINAGIGAEEIDLFIGGNEYEYVNYDNSRFHPKHILFIKDILGEGMAITGIYQVFTALHLLNDNYTNVLIHLCGHGGNSSSIILSKSAASK